MGRVIVMKTNFLEAKNAINVNPGTTIFLNANVRFTLKICFEKSHINTTIKFQFCINR